MYQNLITILAFGLKKSELLAWAERNYTVLSKANQKIVAAYHVEDAIADAEKLTGLDIDFVQGDAAPDKRLRLVLKNIKTPYVALAGSDDLIVGFPENIDGWGDADVILGNYYFVEGANARPSTTNAIDPSYGLEQTLVQYWAPPNPSDNSIYYAIVRPDILRKEYSSLAGKPYEACDWYFVHERLALYQVKKDPRYILLREQTEHDKYTQRILGYYEQIKLEPKGWRMQNPVLYTVKKIQEITPRKLHNQLYAGWAAMLYRKYEEMCRLSPAYSAEMRKIDLLQESIKIVTALETIDLYEIQFPELSL